MSTFTWYEHVRRLSLKKSLGNDKKESSFMFNMAAGAKSIFCVFSCQRVAKNMLNIKLFKAAVPRIQLGSISSKFYEQLLQAQIPKVQKRKLRVVSLFCTFGICACNSCL